MKKLMKLVLCALLIVGVLSVMDIWNDKKTLRENLIRLHIVGNSDSQEDQQVKLQLKDAVTEYLQPIMEKFPSKEEAMAYIRQNLSALQTFSNQILDHLGVSDRARVTLETEGFDTREYDTFSLPAGVYDGLRIEIGDAEGANWWCVAFPGLCLPSTSDGFEAAAVSSGFSQSLVNTLTGNPGYRVRFFLLDKVGRLENILIRLK